MQRVTVSLDDALASDFDDLSRARSYLSRSEAVRDLMRNAVGAFKQERRVGDCVASLSYVYNHHERMMAMRLTDLQHHHHQVVLATTHVHLDEETCLESIMLKGTVKDVRAFADIVLAERGIMHGTVNIIVTGPPQKTGGHGPHGHSHPKHPK